MALNAGNQDATTGIAKAIYDAMDAALSPPLVEAGADMTKVRDGWKKLSFAVASGVVAGLIDTPPSDTSFGETYSTPAQDAKFWPWLAGFVGAFRSWAPTSPDGQALKARLNAFIVTSAVPTELKGKIK
jgi:hypothetical protein